MYVEEFLLPISPHWHLMVKTEQHLAVIPVLVPSSQGSTAIAYAKKLAKDRADRRGIAPLLGLTEERVDPIQGLERQPIHLGVVPK